MAIRGQRSKSYSVGEAPPQVEWTIVRGDTAAFRVYVVDDTKQALNIPDWTIQMEVKRPTLASNAGIITDDAQLILTLHPVQDANDGPGEFTVSLLSTESEILQTGDIFDIELSLPGNTVVWTVAQGSLKVLEDVTA